MSELQATCVCGGLIVAGASWAVADAVERHNATDRHHAWRRRREVVEANGRRRQRVRDELAARRAARAVAREWGWA
jgi:hypothetical protein